MSSTRVTYTERGDTGVLKWGESGAEHEYAPGDDAAFLAAYKSAVAEGLSHGDTFSDEVERSIARELQSTIGITFEPRDELGGLSFDWTQAIFDPRDVRKDVQDSSIIGWFPGVDVSTALSEALGTSNMSPGIPVSNTGYPLHLTVLFLGDPDVDGTSIDLQLVAAVTKLFTRWREPLQGCISGLGRFVGPEDTDVIVALVDIPGLLNLRHCLKDDLQCQSAIPYNSPLYNEQHGFVPHITLAYVPKSQASPPPLTETIPITIDSLTLSNGSDNQITFSLGCFPGDSHAEPSLDPYFASRESYQLAKAGRVLSGKNMKALKDAIETLTTVHDSAKTAEDAPVEKGSEEEVAKRREFLKAVAGVTDQDFAMEYLVTKSTAEDRYTLGPLYAPMRMDAHGEYAGAETLQKAMWDFVQSKFDAGDNRLNLQHGTLGEIQVANMVEVVTWPYDHTITVTKADGGTTDLEMPAGTVYLGAIWDDDAWPLVKSGKLNGWSLGGKAIRVAGAEGDLPHMGYKLAERGGAPAPTRKAGTDDLAMEMLRMAATEAVELRERERRASELEREQITKIREAAREDRETVLQERGLLAGAFEAMKSALTKQGDAQPGETHVHLGAQDIHVHEAPVEVHPAAVNVTVEKDAPVSTTPEVHVHMPDRITTVPAETETVAERGADGLIARSVTRITGR